MVFFFIAAAYAQYIYWLLSIIILLGLATPPSFWRLTSLCVCIYIFSSFKFWFQSLWAQLFDNKQYPDVTS